MSISECSLYDSFDIVNMALTSIFIMNFFTLIAIALLISVVSSTFPVVREAIDSWLKLKLHKFIK